MAVIGEYQRGPLLPAGAARDDAAAGDDTADERSVSGQTAGSGAAWSADGDTARSGTALPGFQSLGSDEGRRTSHRARRRRLGQALGAAARPGNARRALLGRALLAVLLLAAGTGLGIWLHGTTAQASSGLGPVIPPPTTCPRPGTTGAPILCISQPWGDGNTVYIVHGTDFGPYAVVTLTLSGVHALPVQVKADDRGWFNYAVDQGHHFFPGLIPTGTYKAVVTAPGDGSTTVSFRVYPVGRVPALPIPQGPPPG
jgi:hypothetical protein